MQIRKVSALFLAVFATAASAQYSQVDGRVNSPSAQPAQVQQFYQKYLGRSPDPAAATPRDIYALVAVESGKTGGGPLTVKVKPAKGEAFDITLNEDGTARRTGVHSFYIDEIGVIRAGEPSAATKPPTGSVVFKDISTPSAATKGAGGGGGAGKASLSDMHFKEQTVPVKTPGGMGFDLVAKTDPSGVLIGLLVPAVQKVR